MAAFARDLSPTQRASARLAGSLTARPRAMTCRRKIAFTGSSKPFRFWSFNKPSVAWQQARYTEKGTTAASWSWMAKALRGSQGTQLVGAINAQSGRTLGVETVADKSTEIPAGQTWLDRLELDGTIALMDALHTQTQTARTVVQERGGDFVLFVKGNQPGLLRQAQHFLPEDFSPSTPAG